MPSPNASRPVVFITGASAGIGAAAVRVFARAGYDVILTARREERLKEIAAEAAREFPQAKFVPVVCDVNSDASVKAVFAVVGERFGRLDVLVNNAGYGVYGSVANTTMEQFRANMETNYFGVIRCTQAALPWLRAAVGQSSGKGWGAAIIMVSSFVGRRALPMMSSYCATKFAMEGLSESLRVELYDERISVSVVNPGVTQTDFVQAAKGSRPANFIQSQRGMTAAAVAEVLLRAVKYPRRNIYLTTEGRMGILFQWLAPRIFDRGLLHTWRKAKRAEKGIGKGPELVGDEIE